MDFRPDLIRRTSVALAFVVFPVATLVHAQSPTAEHKQLPDFFALKSETIRCSWQTGLTPDIHQMTNCLPRGEKAAGYPLEHANPQHFLDRFEERIRTPSIGFGFDLDTFKPLEPQL